MSRSVSKKNINFSKINSNFILPNKDRFAAACGYLKRLIPPYWFLQIGADVIKPEERGLTDMTRAWYSYRTFFPSSSATLPTTSRSPPEVKKLPNSIVSKTNNPEHSCFARWKERRREGSRTACTYVDKTKGGKKADVLESTAANFAKKLQKKHELWIDSALIKHVSPFRRHFSLSFSSSSSSSSLNSPLPFAFVCYTTSSPLHPIGIASMTWPWTLKKNHANFYVKQKKKKKTRRI